ncbi:hypothetical protein AVEN_2763-1 [Araneus ventricosus]|uniref:Uncharacterized protein n=1 Tax=Araneus ventricosus TaxID=182803 RepID=A0A4Y2I0R6_ARAVE|nr:hypothetical protein AVEN_2763-1 [Araneus ventricosus]
MPSASEVTSFHVSSQANDLRLLTVWAMGSLVSVQLRRDIPHFFLIRSSEKLDDSGIFRKSHKLRASSLVYCKLLQANEST